MKKMLRICLSLFAAVILFAIAAPAASASSTWVDEAITGLQGRSIYVSPSADRASAPDVATLEAQLRPDDHIKIAVMPSEAGDVNAFADELAPTLNGQYTLFVTVDGPATIRSNELSSDAVARINGQLGSGSADAVLSAFIAATHAETETRTSTGTTVPGDGGFPVGAAAGGGGVFLAAAVIAAVIMRRRKAGHRAHSPSRADLRQAPDAAVRKCIQDIRSRIDGIEYERMRAQTEEICAKVEHLFVRIRKDDPTRIQEYGAIFEEYLQTIGRVVDRYIDVQESPFYKDAERSKILEQGQQSIDGFVEFVNEKGRDVNQNALFAYTVDTRIIKGTRPDTTDILNDTKELGHGN